jgi:Ni,Fe-hydrogenase I cytochrome b subunit
MRCLKFLWRHIDVVLQMVLIVVLCFSVYYSRQNNQIIKERESFIQESRQAYADILKQCGNGRAH